MAESAVNKSYTVFVSAITKIFKVLTRRNQKALIQRCEAAIKNMLKWKHSRRES